MSKDCRSKETNAFEVEEEEPFCVDMSSIELNALKIGSAHVPDGKSQDLQWNGPMCGSVAVFPKEVVEDHPVLKTPGKAKSYRQARRYIGALARRPRATVPQDTNMQRA